MFTKISRSVAFGTALAIALAAGAAIAASGFVGKWATTDSEGKPFTIWLSEDGTAKGDRANEGLAGMWKEEGGAAVITWDTNWVTTISKDGEAYSKSVTKDGKPVGEKAKAEKTE